MSEWEDVKLIDQVLKIGASKIQHGKNSDRIYLMHLAPEETDFLLGRLAEIAAREGYSKIFARVPFSSKGSFLRGGYQEEAVVPDLFSGKEDGCFMSRFLDNSRAVESDGGRIAEVLAQAQAREGKRVIDNLPGEYRLRQCVLDDAEEMASLYGSVFSSYPFAIDDAGYIGEAMQENAAYFGVWQGTELVALAAAEQYIDEGFVEMTDFATHVPHRNKGLATALLTEMERVMLKRGFMVCYTIAEAVSYGMNITFARRGFHFAGTLVNNTQLHGRITSMNVWYKDMRYINGKESLQ